MLVTPVFFSASLNARLDKADRTLPLNKADSDRLMAAMEEDDYAYLVIRDPVGAEIVKVTNTCGGLLVDRGQDGTDAMNFPKGSCVRHEMTPAVVKDLICNYNCCEGDCPCDPVESAGITLPAAKVGVAWNGNAVFTGDTPMELSATGVPAWATITLGANYIAFSGTPTGAGSFNISVAGTNCGGAIAVQQGVLTITV